MLKKVFMNKEYLFDDQDKDLIEMINWRSDGNDYLRATINNKRVRFHRFIMNDPEGKEVDHINRNRRDNRRENLRVASHSLNMHNIAKCKGSTSKYRGVCFDKSLKEKGCKRCYKAYFIRKHLGNFMTEREAAEAYNIAAIKRYGDNAFLNEVNDACSY